MRGPTPPPLKYFRVALAAIRSGWLHVPSPSFFREPAAPLLLFKAPG